MKRKRLKRILAGALAACLTLGSVLLHAPAMVSAANMITLNEANFPDENFRNYLIETFGHGSDTINAEAVTGIGVGGKNIADLTGIEKFPNLRSLYVQSNKSITSLDLSNNTELEELDCSGTGIKSLDLSKNTKLEELNCSSTDMESLDLTNNTKLLVLECRSSSLKSLDLSKSTGLKELQCSNNNFTELDLRNNTALEKLQCQNGAETATKLTTLDLSNNVNLKELDLWNNDLTELDLSGNVQLLQLNVSGNPIRTLDVSNNVNLEEIYIDTAPQLENLDVSSNSKLSKLTVIKCPSLKTVELNGAVLLDYARITSNEQLGSLDISNNTALSKLFCSGNALTELIVSDANSALTYLDCSKNQLLSLDFAKLVNLKTIVCSSNANLGASFDVSALSELETIYCDGIGLESLNVANNIKLKTLKCNFNKLSELDVSANTALEQLECYTNQLTSLDISANTALQILDCSDNELTDLDLTNNTKLTNLSVAVNRIPCLDLSSNVNLKKTSLYQSINITEQVGTSFDLKDLNAKLDGDKISDLSMNSDISTPELSGTILSGYMAGRTIYYGYDCGNGIEMRVTLQFDNVKLDENEWTVAPSMADWTYGQTPSEPVAASKYGTPEFTYSDSRFGTYTTTAPTTAGTWWIIARVPTKVSQYKEIWTAFSYNIYQAEPTYTVPTGLTAVTEQTLADVALPTGFEWMDSTQSVGTVGNNTFMAKYIPDDTVNYKTVENISITVEVSKRPTPVNEWTTELTMSDWTYGQTPSQPNAVSKYGTVEYTYSDKADGTFTGAVPTTAGTWYVKAAVQGVEDTYTGLESAPVKYTILQATPSFMVPTGLKATAGQTLADIALPAGFTWMDSTQSVGAAGNNTFMAKYVPNDTANYKTVENISVTVEVSKKPTPVNEWTTTLTMADWTYGQTPSQPNAVSKYGMVEYTYSDKADGTFTGAVPTTAGTWYVKAVVQGVEDTYTGLESIPVKYTILQATPGFTVPTGLTAITGQTLADIALPAGFTWMDGTQSVGEIGNNTFMAKYIPDDTVNYKTVENISVSVGVKAAQPSIEAPDTSDRNNIAWFIMLMMLSGAVLVSAAVYSGKKRNI